MNYSHCNDEMCKEWFPYYGLAPHEHKISPASNGYIGSTELKHKSVWPANFVEDKDAPGCGVYYCPKCFNGMEMTDEQPNTKS